MDRNKYVGPSRCDWPASGGVRRLFEVLLLLTYTVGARLCDLHSESWTPGVA